MCILYFEPKNLQTIVVTFKLYTNSLFDFILVAIAVCQNKIFRVTYEHSWNW